MCGCKHRNALSLASSYTTTLSWASQTNKKLVITETSLIIIFQLRYPCRCTRTLPTGFLTIKMSYTILWYMSECMAFPGPIFTELTNGQQHYVQSSYNEFGPNWAINLESTDRNPFTTLRKIRIFIVPIFTKHITTQ